MGCLFLYFFIFISISIFFDAPIRAVNETKAEILLHRCKVCGKAVSTSHKTKSNLNTYFQRNHADYLIGKAPSSILDCDANFLVYENRDKNALITEKLVGLVAGNIITPCSIERPEFKDFVAALNSKLIEVTLQLLLQPTYDTNKSLPYHMEHFQFDLYFIFTCPERRDQKMFRSDL